MKYDLIVCDPPWCYNDKQKHIWSGAESHYDVMSTDDLCKLDIKKIAEKDSFCLMWMTMPMLDDWLRVMKAWWFKPKTALFVWVKLNKIALTPVKWLWYYTRSNIEILYIGKRGKWFKVEDNSFSQLIFEPRGEHSRKPSIVMENIKQMFGDKRRIELFARRSQEWFDVIGNEIDGTTIEDYLINL